MRNLIAPLLVLLAACLPAKADADVTFKIIGATMTVTVNRTVTDEDAARIVAHAKRAYSTIQVAPTVTGADCLPPDPAPVDPWTRPAACDPTTRETTPQEAVSSMISDNFSAIIRDVLAGEKRAAAVAAAAAIDPIVPK